MELTNNRSPHHRSGRSTEVTKGDPTAKHTKAPLRAAVLLTTVVASVFLIFSSGVEADSAPRQTVLHVVQPGDTLWDLARRHTPAGGDVRATVGHIRHLNGLPGSTVEVGTALHIPSG